MTYLKKILFLYLFIINSSLAQTSLSQIAELSEAEKKWLSEHPVIRIAFDKNLPPFEWQDKQGIYQGISVETMQLIERQLNIKFEQVEPENWSQLLKDFKAGKIDVLPAIAQNEKRQQYMFFTRTHTTIPGVIISSRQYNDISELKGKKVGVVKDYIWDDLITQYDEEIEIVRVETSQMGIELAVLGIIDAMVNDLASVSYIINEQGISNLHVVPVSSNQKQKMQLAIGVRKDWPELRTILQKALDSLAQEDTERIYNKWIKLQKISFWQSSKFWTVVLMISLIIIVIFSLILFWNHSLKLKVSRRSEQLEKAHVQLIHAEKMESIGRLSAGVAHEVKNPLAILQMSVDYLKGENNDDTTKTILDDMEDAIIRADKVIKGLLDYSREKELQVSLGNINEVIDTSLRLIEHELKQRNIHLKTSLADNLPELAMDRNRLQQVFINLFMNAVQAIGSLSEKKTAKQNSDEIVVSSYLSKIEDRLLLEESEGLFYLHQNVIVVDILDTGCGLNKNNEKEVFEPFFTTKPVGEGTGLGLSVSKTIIGLHHGMITMKNRIDNMKADIKIKGVEVKIYFAINGV